MGNFRSPSNGNVKKDKNQYKRAPLVPGTIPHNTLHVPLPSLGKSRLHTYRGYTVVDHNDLHISSTSGTGLYFVIVRTTWNVRTITVRKRKGRVVIPRAFFMMLCVGFCTRKRCGVLGYCYGMILRACCRGLELGFGSPFKSSPDSQQGCMYQIYMYRGLFSVAIALVFFWSGLF